MRRLVAAVTATYLLAVTTAVVWALVLVARECSTARSCTERCVLEPEYRGLRCYEDCR